MFRNPRENQHRTSVDVLKPSVGRPPSPHSSTPRPALDPFVPNNTPEGSRLSSNMGTKTVTPTPPTRKTATPRATPAKPKPSAPKNGNILSFFKKADNGPAADPLFVGRSDWVGFATKDTPEDASIQDEELPEEFTREDGSSDRFNESGGPNKRRRVSLNPEEEKDAAIQYDPRAAAIGGEACSPPPPNFNDERNPENGQEANKEPISSKAVPKRTGPFVEDSDSDEDDAKVAEARVPSDSALLEDGTSRKASPLGEELPETTVKVEDDEDVAPPTLKRESTSYPDMDGFADFEGMEDFEDEYEGGDEFVEKRWQMQQMKLEMEEEGREGALDEGDSAKDEQPISGEDASSCPVCEASFAGISDQEASVHVNHCLDGNPTPLPTPKSQPEVKVEQKPDAGHQRFRRPVRPAKPGQENPFTLGQSNGTSSAFSKLMSGHAEDTAWATAAAEEHASRGKPAYQRTCPFYKILPGFNICVDAFRYGAVQGCNAYFLSHFHSDHYIGLTGTWSHGPIYASKATTNLVKQQLRVDPKYVIALEFEKKVEVPGTNGVFVTMIPANHCPGSSLYLFEKVIGKGARPKVQRVLHCGDFRACPAHVEHPLLKPDTIDSISGQSAQQKIDVCYLDTTYLNPKYAFPSQEEVIKACADMCISLNKTKVDVKDDWEQTKAARAGGTMSKFVRKDSKDEAASISASTSTSTHNPTDKPRGALLVVVGTYSIGKERICLGIARALGSKIYAPPGKQRICAALEDAELSSRLTSDPRAAQVHMTPLFDIRAETLGDYLAEYSDHFSRAVGFRPSGWNYRPPGTRFTDSPGVETVLYSDNWKSGYSMRDLVPQRGSNARSATYGVPYSEHSSFRELTMFCCALRIDKVVPTVNIGSAKSRERMKLWVERWNTWKKKEGLFQVAREENGANAWYPGPGTWQLRTTL